MAAVTCYGALAIIPRQTSGFAALDVIERLGPESARERAAALTARPAKQWRSPAPAMAGPTTAPTR